MSWDGNPGTAIAGSVLTATFWNVEVRDRMNVLRGGGLAISGQAAGDIPYATGATQVGVLPADVGKFLKSGPGAPSWADVAFSDLTGSIADGQVPESAVDQHVDPLTLTAAAPATPAPNTLYRNTILKGWLVYDGVTNTILDQVNVTSVTDNGAGDYTIEWETHFADANYAVVVTAAESTEATVEDIVSIAAGSVRISVKTSGGGVGVDVPRVCVIAVGKN